jgi:hypothetical protein
MTLSACSTCKNAADSICLLGQSYIDVYESVQSIADEQHRETVAQSLAGCSFWEESKLAKLISRDVTLSHHAWSRIAYLKLQPADQDMFAGLITVARSVVHSPEADPAPAPASLAESTPPDPAPTSLTESSPPPEPAAATTPDNPIDVAPPEPSAPPAEATSDPTPVTALEPTPLSSEACTEEPSEVCAEPSPETCTEEPCTESFPEAFTAALDDTTSLNLAADGETDPVEQAMRELWTSAISNHTQPPATDIATAHWGRGSGRIAEASNPSTSDRQDLPRAMHQTLPGIA